MSRNSSNAGRGASFRRWTPRSDWATSGHPPGNRLQALKGDRAGQHSIRITERWRICLVWRAGEAGEVEIVDYHKG